MCIDIVLFSLAEKCTLDGVMDCSHSISVPDTCIREPSLPCLWDLASLHVSHFGTKCFYTCLYPFLSCYISIRRKVMFTICGVYHEYQVSCIGLVQLDIYIPVYMLYSSYEKCTESRFFCPNVHCCMRAMDKLLVSTACWHLSLMLDANSRF